MLYSVLRSIIILIHFCLTSFSYKFCLLNLSLNIALRHGVTSFSFSFLTHFTKGEHPSLISSSKLTKQEHQSFQFISSFFFLNYTELFRFIFPFLSQSYIKKDSKWNTNIINNQLLWLSWLEHPFSMREVLGSTITRAFIFLSPPCASFVFLPYLTSIIFFRNVQQKIILLGEFI